MGAKGRLAKFLLATFEGFELLGMEPSPGRGGAIHRHVQQLIVDSARGKGWHATIEKNLGKENICDVFLEKENQRLAIEIAVTSKPGREIEHMKSALAAGCDRIITVFADERLLIRTQEAMTGALSGEETAKVQLVPLRKMGWLM